MQKRHARPHPPCSINMALPEEEGTVVFYFAIPVDNPLVLPLISTILLASFIFRVFEIATTQLWKSSPLLAIVTIPLKLVI